MIFHDISWATRTPGSVYGDISGFHLLVGQEDFYPDEVARQVAQAEPERLDKGMGRLTSLLRAALLLEGVDLSGGAFISRLYRNRCWPHPGCF